MEQSFATIGTEVGLTGDVADGLDYVRDAVNSKKGALHRVEENAQLAAGNSVVFTAGFDRAMEDENFERAQSILDMDGAAEAMGLEAHRALRRILTVERRRREVGANKFETEIADIENVLGRPLTQQEKRRKANIDPPEGRQSLQEWIQEFTDVTGTPPTREQIEKKAGALIEVGSTFGAGIEGKVLEIFSRDAVAFADDLLTAQGERVFQSALTQWLQPRMVLNPDTQVPELFVPTLPPYVKEALEQRGIDPDVYTEAASGDADPGLDLSSPDIAEVPHEKSLWGSAPLITGPVSSVANRLAKTPGIGNFFPSPETVQARARSQRQVADLVRILQNNPRFSEAERAAIKDELNMNPEFFDTTQALQNRLIGFADSLEARKQQALAVMSGSAAGTTLADRQWALRALTAVAGFEPILGVPPLVRTRAEAAKLPPDALFRTPDNRVFRNTQLRVNPQVEGQ